ncbi:preprotein translocase subunit YajC [Rappaport israeli]|uniref:preprotein translocase subunit YajC n=1 Tax=Rappaport israeli TaxID=1839807 RepID=UPI0009317330|nr:preprotein translocase subunit YajC [Rappaport israeli]
MLFIEQAYAQAAPGQASAGGGMLQLVMMVGIFAIMWFFMIAPQRKRMKEHKAMVAALKKGDEVITGGGLMGRVVALDEYAIDLEIARNTVVRLQRQFVTQVLPKGSLKGNLGEQVAANDVTRDE